MEFCVYSLYAIIHGILKNSGLSQVEANRLYPLILGELERITTNPDLIKESRRPLKGAKETLSPLSSQVVQTYATGNSPARAEAKLARFQMNHFLDLEIGGFGWWTGKRSDFVQRAIDLAQDKYQKEFRVVVIGDTPFDIESAHTVGATAVAVAGGVFSAKDLEASNPHLILNDLSGDELNNFLIKT